MFEKNPSCALKICQDKSRRFMLKTTCEANAAGENSSFIFTVRVKSVPFYHFKRAYVVLHQAVKNVFETHF